MRVIILILSCLVITKTNAQNAIGSIGTWREHYNNATIQQVIKGDQYYLASKIKSFPITKILDRLLI